LAGAAFFAGGGGGGSGLPRLPDADGGALRIGEHASQPMPGTSIFGTTIVAPWAAALATVWSTSSTPT
jgi:hypothetical protein